MMSDFSGDSFFSQCLALSCVFLLGLSFGSLLKLIFSLFRPNEQRCSSARFVALCVSLTFSAISYTILIFGTKNLFPYSGFSILHKDYYFFLSGIFVFSALLSLFWKIMLPVSLVLYLSFSFFSLHILNSLFGSQSLVIPVRIEENSVIIGKKSVSKNPELHQTIKISTFHLPDTLVLPVKRNWFLVGGLSVEKKLDDSDSDSGNPVLLEEFENPEILENRLFRFYVNHFVLAEEPAVLQVPLPCEHIFPSLFSAHISFKSGKIFCEIVRDL